MTDEKLEEVRLKLLIHHQEGLQRQLIDGIGGSSCREVRNFSQINQHLKEVTTRLQFKRWSREVTLDKRASFPRGNGWRPFRISFFFAIQQGEGEMREEEVSVLWESGRKPESRRTAQKHVPHMALAGHILRWEKLEWERGIVARKVLLY